jgi:hypothetical protein
MQLVRRWEGVPAVLLFVALGCSAPAPQPTQSSPTPRPLGAAKAAPEQPKPAAPPPGFVEGELGDIAEEGFGEGRHLIFIRGKDTGSVPGSIDDITFEFIERFRKDRGAAVAWAETHPELKAEVAVARRLVRAHYEVQDDAFSFRLYDNEGPVESERPHVAILISGAPFFIQIEALEGFAY